jgi:hypothetical protein
VPGPRPLWCLIATLVLVVPGVATAQAREPLRGFVADLRLLSTTLPNGPGWTPELSSGELVPGRGFGLEGGALSLVGPGRYRRLGVGLSGLFTQGRATGVEPAPTVTTRFMAGASHASMNFGHAPGWSYLSLGVGLAKVTSEYVGGSPDPSGWGTAIHYGGGARWFLTEHVALSLDLRFWALTPRAASDARPSSPATTRFTLGGGLAFR